MNRMQKSLKSNYGLWAVIGACLVATVFSIISIFSSYQLHTNMAFMVHHPVRVSSAVYGFGRIVSEMEVRVGRLVFYNTPADILLVRTALSKLARESGTHLDYMRKNYIGPHEQPERVAALFGEIEKRQEALLEKADGMERTLIARTIDTELTPLYRELDGILSKKMLFFIDHTPKRLLDGASAILRLNVALSLFLSLLLVAAAFVGQRIIRRRMEEQTYRNSILKIISENAGSVFMLYHLKQGMEYVSPNVQALLGVSSVMLETNPRALLEHCAPEDAAAFGKLLYSEIVRTPLEKECLFKNLETGEERWALVGFYPVRERDAVTRYVISISDMTEMRKTQQVLRDALLSAQHANKAKSMFLSRMSHEIRTPMNAVIGMTAIASAALSDPARLENCLTKIAISSRHLLMLINDVLDMSKIESGKFAITNEPFDVTELVRNVTSIVYSQACSREVRFDSAAEVEHEMLRGDMLRLNQILLNILSNAVKFTPPGGSVRLAIKEIPQRFDDRLKLRFTISDTGKGMSPAFLERLFTPFEQEEGLSARGGTGLGMAITSNLVTLMQGTIRVSSSPGEGSTFVVELPFETAEAAPCPAGSFDDLKVMVVDADQGSCEYAAITLSRMGVTAEWALSGAEAVERVVTAYERDESYDVVFMDWKVPDVDGIEATRRIRRHVGPETVIIILSAYDWTEIEQEAREAGANAFITKPMFQSSIYNTLVSVTRGVPQERRRDGTQPDFAGKRLLLAEDNELNREVAVELLKMTGVHTVTAEDGAEAVRLFSESRPGTYDGILMDVQMPKMDGYQATRAIRALDRPDAAAIPILAMTANAFAEDIAAALQSGMNGHIGKPIDVSSLFATLEKVLLHSA